MLLLQMTDAPFCIVCSCSGYIVGRIGKAAALATGGSLIILVVILLILCYTQSTFAITATTA